MKKIIVFIISFILCNCMVLAEECNSYYKVNINIEGKGKIVLSGTEKEIKEDTTLNVKCDDNLIFTAEANEGYILQGVYSDGNHISSDNNKFGIFNIISNPNIKIIFGEEKEEKDNYIYVSSYEDNISLFIDDIKNDLDSKTKLDVTLKEINILFDNSFIKNSNDNLTIVANEIYKKDLNVKEKSATKNSLYYDFHIYNGEKENNKLNGKAIITIPYSKSDSVYVYEVLKDGKITLLDSKYDQEKVTFTVDEFHLIAVSPDKLDELNYVRNIVKLNNEQIIALVAGGFVLALLVLLIRKRRK